MVINQQQATAQADGIKAQNVAVLTAMLVSQAASIMDSTQPKVCQQRIGIDRKRMRELRRKKIALGHAAGDMEVNQ